MEAKKEEFGRMVQMCNIQGYVAAGVSLGKTSLCQQEKLVGRVPACLVAVFRYRDTASAERFS